MAMFWTPYLDRRLKSVQSLSKIFLNFVHENLDLIMEELYNNEILMINWYSILVCWDYRIGKKAIKNILSWLPEGSVYCTKSLAIVPLTELPSGKVIITTFVGNSVTPIRFGSPFRTNTEFPKSSAHKSRFGS